MCVKRILNEKQGPHKMANAENYINTATFRGITVHSFGQVRDVVNAANLGQIETLADLQELLRRNNIFETMNGGRRLFKQDILKTMLTSAGVSGVNSLRWDVRGAETRTGARPSLGSVASLAVMRTRILQGGANAVLAPRRGAPSRPPAQAPQVRAPSPVRAVTGIGVFEPDRCARGLQNQYSLQELRALADRYLITIDHNDTQASLCKKLTEHWTKWMAGRLLDMFRQRPCLNMERI